MERVARIGEKGTFVKMYPRDINGRDIAMKTQRGLEGSGINGCLHELKELVFFILHIHLCLCVS